MRSYSFCDIKYLKKLVKSRDVSFFENCFQLLQIIGKSSQSRSYVRVSASIPISLTSQDNETIVPEEPGANTNAICDNGQIQLDSTPAQEQIQHNTFQISWL